MEKQMILMANATASNKRVETTRRMAEMAATPLRLIRSYYSMVLEREVSQRQANAITEAQLAFFAFVLPADYSLLLRAAACAWLLFSVRKVRRMMADEKHPQ